MSDDAFLLFYWIEDMMIDKLTSHIRESALLTPDESEERKKIMIELVVYDCDVQHRWSVVSSDISEGSDSVELLTHIVSLWLTIRGYAISKSWMED